MTGIIEFLTARLDEDEAAALATTSTPVPGSWRPSQDKHADENAPLSLIQGRDEDDAPDRIDYSYGNPVIVHAADWQEEAEANLAHIARHDPARVLREVAAKRRIVEDYALTCRLRDEAAERIRQAFASGRLDAEAHDTWERANREAGLLDTVMRQLASPYADHPDYQEAWKL